jgi:tetratricopeptide (TPR) repeat protein
VISLAPGRIRLGAWLAAAILMTQSAAIASPTNAVAGSNATSVISSELKRLEALSAAAAREVESWIQTHRFSTNQPSQTKEELNQRIEARLGEVQKEYERLAAAYPTNDLVRVDYASFLSDVKRDEPAALKQLETALRFNTNNADIYNNLANIYGHIGSVRKAFDFYNRAIELNPRESVYYHNFGTTVFLFRTDAKEHYDLNEQQVFDKALDLYAKAMKFDGTNFDLASDVALTYYGIQPPRIEAALQAWTNALRIAQSPSQRQEVALHLARLKIKNREFEQARAVLNTVTNQEHLDVKQRLERTLERATSGKDDESAAEPNPAGSAKVTF